MEPPTDVVLERVDPASVWAGDRLIVWGGWSGCFGYSDAFELGYELIPDWDVGDPHAGAGGALAREGAWVRAALNLPAGELQVVAQFPHHGVNVSGVLDPITRDAC